MSESILVKCISCEIKNLIYDDFQTFFKEQRRVGIKAQRTDRNIAENKLTGMVQKAVSWFEVQSNELTFLL